MDLHASKKWVDVFGNAPSLTVWKAEQYAKNITLTYPIVVPFSGDGIKLRFSNRYGKETVTISKWCVVRMDDEWCVLGGGGAFSLKGGEEYETPELPVQIFAQEKLAVQFYLGEFTNMTSGVFTSGEYSGGETTEGDYVGKAPDVNWTVSTNWNYFLTDVYIRTDMGRHTVVFYGDSITAQDWPDYCYKKLMERAENSTAVVRKAVSGTRLLRQYECNKYRSYGIKGDTRFLHECNTYGADAVLIQHGINDIIHPVGEDKNVFRPWSDLPTAEEMIGCYRRYIRTARELGMRVYFGTLLPIEGWRTYADFREELRQALNTWIRETDEIDGVADFDAELRDPERPSAFLPRYDSGDHLHPSKAGYERMGECAFNLLESMNE